jgi:hypothetical protein
MLVGIKAKHSLSVRLILRNRTLNLFSMTMIIPPTVREVLGTKRRVGTKDIHLTESKLTCANQRPDRNTRTADASFTTAHGGIFVDAGKTLAEIARNTLQKRSFFARRHPREQSFGVGKKWHD